MGVAAAVAAAAAAMSMADAAAAGRTFFASGLPLELVSIWQVTSQYTRVVNVLRGARRDDAL